MTMMMKMMIKRISVEKLNQMMMEIILFTQTCPHTRQMIRKKNIMKKRQMMMMKIIKRIVVSLWEEDEEDEELYGDLNLNLDR
uniref:Uncharacterized protein n=1 Tax=Tanacetum cinerariifolium TaxID=118510 RepID=A0A699XCJ6_TANCI|nr:hypothetical protein [Tanacetum cinerariifolium]